MKKAVILFLAMIFVFGLGAAVYGQGMGGSQQPGMGMQGLPSVTGKESAPFEAKSQDDAHNICDQVANAYKFDKCTEMRGTESTENAPRLWYCVCK